VVVGAWDARRVVAHANGTLGLRTQAGVVSLAGVVRTLTVNCTQTPSAGAARLSPCASDLLPMARDALAGAPIAHGWPGGALLAKLPKLTFEGVQLDLSDLEGQTRGRPARLDLSVRARAVVTRPNRAGGAGN
jgi:hypothetical protein